MTLKKYFCYAKKKKMIWAKSWIDANEKFAKFLEENEIEAHVNLWTDEDAEKARKSYIAYKRRKK